MPCAQSGFILLRQGGADGERRHAAGMGDALKESPSLREDVLVSKESSQVAGREPHG